MTSRERLLVFNKFEGKCAYCGTDLVKGWHVDHIEPLRRNYSEEYDWDLKKIVRKSSAPSHPERDNLPNYNPSCASCNINKHGMSIEQFRLQIQGFMKHLNEINTQYKIAKRYGLVKEDIKPIVFYFEACGK